jgi:trehalose 6-phosphate synthase/phosphatase
LPADSKYFWYRYAIYRGGAFYRWERPSDAPSDPALLRRPPSGHRGGAVTHAESAADAVVPIADLSMDDSSTHVHTTSTSDKLLHELSLLRLSDRESYLVHDVLGVTTGQTDLEHIRPPTQPTYVRASSLHSRDNSGSGSVFSNAMHPSGSTGSAVSLGKSPVPSSRKVGFAPAAPHFQYNTVNNNPKALTTKQAVHLNSTDGLVVVSVFLPVIMHRSEQGAWSADWDYEMLLSMQTHLRVTRIGVVKWRGWHGNKGHSGSPEAGVPEEERDLVEDCLRPFNCVPVWVDPATFGEM